MVDQIKKGTGTVLRGAGVLLNSQYNKAAYATVVGAGVDFLFSLLTEFHIDVSAGLQSKTLILAMALTALLVPNKPKNDEEV